MMNCPRCNAPAMYGAQYCTNCNFNFAAAQFQPQEQATEAQREKRYKILLIILSCFFIFDGIFWRIMSKLSDKFGYEIYDYSDPYSWLATLAFASLPLVVGILLPKSTPWRLILIIGGSIWLAFRVYDLISAELFPENPYVFYQF